MAITQGILPVLLREHQRRPFAGRVLTLGRQDILFSWATFAAIARAHIFPLRSILSTQLSPKKDDAQRGYLSDDFFWKTLGFSSVDSLDCVSDEHPTIIFDLNNAHVPEHLRECADVIIDGGVIEHVFHIPNVLRNIFRMLRIDGRILHFSPSANFVDHGFYSLSPTLFWDFYTANAFDISPLQFVRGFPGMEGECTFEEYAPGALDARSFGGLDGAPYGTVCIATKTSLSTGDRIPRQSLYAEDRLKRSGGGSPALAGSGAGR